MEPSKKRWWVIENAETGTTLGEYLAETAKEALALFQEDLEEPLLPQVRAVPMDEDEEWGRKGPTE